MLQSGYADQTEQRHIFKEILRRMDDVGWMVGDLLDYTKPLAVKREDVRLLDPLERALFLLTLDASLQRTTILRDYRCDPVLCANPNLLERVFLNLTLNAVQSMQFCGELTIRVSEVERSIAIAFAEKPSVMEKATREQIFGPFYSAKAGGSGIGLFLGRKYVEAHQGSIEVQTQHGLGSICTVLLPRPVTAPRAPL